METLNVHRVVVTGWGTVNALGNNVEDFWASLLAGKSGIRPVTRFDVSELPTKIASEVVDFDPANYMDPKEAGRTDPFVHYAVAASKMAANDADIKITDVESERCGVIIGTGIGGMTHIQEQSCAFFKRSATCFSIYDSFHHL